MAEQAPNAVVTLRNQVSPWLMILQVVPYGWDFPDYKPGQFAMLGLPGTASRCAAAEPESPLEEPERLIKRAYSLASSPMQREYLEFYIALVPGGTLTPRLFNLKIGDRVWLSKIPSGRFTYDDTCVTEGSSLVLCTTGAGLAPLFSMLATHLKFPPQRRVVLIHGVRHSWDLGYRSILMAMEHLRTTFTYIPVISRPGEEFVPWKGATGHVQDVWKSGAIEKAWGNTPTPDNTHVFMCGSPDMSQSMIALLEQEGFKVDDEDGLGQIHVENYWQKTS